MEGMVLEEALGGMSMQRGLGMGRVWGIMMVGGLIGETSIRIWELNGSHNAELRVLCLFYAIQKQFWVP